jgi:hypothetical protein
LVVIHLGVAKIERVVGRRMEPDGTVVKYDNGAAISCSAIVREAGWLYG